MTTEPSRKRRDTSRTLVAQLQKVESDIKYASQNLEKSFKDVNKRSMLSRGSTIPDPIKLVRRLTALEMALGHLKDDCEAITSRRTLLVRNVMEKQNRNISQVEKMLESLESSSNNNNKSSFQDEDHDDGADDGWDVITQAWNRQSELCTSTAVGK